MAWTAALAGSPIALILLLMLGLGWSAARAGVAGVAVAGALAWWAFGFGADGTSPAGPAGDYAGVLAEAGFLAATILWILWPALALHQHQQRCGALDALRAGLSRLTPHRPLQALLVGWFLALFLEGAAGFGTPIALAAPILVGLGIAPLQAVVLALLGHAAGVSFGALGTPVIVQAGLTGLDTGDIAWRTASLHTLLGGLLMVFFVRAQPASTDRPGTGWAALAALGFLLPSFALAVLLGPELATLGGALAGGTIFVWALRRRARAPAVPAGAGDLGRAFKPYALIVALVLGTRALAGVLPELGGAALEWQLFGRYGARMQPLTHPGSVLFAALLLGALWQGVPLRELVPAFSDAARRLVPVAVALLAMLALSRLMLHAGMVDALQAAAVRGVGRAWPLVAPAVGALGSFVTGSATASNVLFTTLQAQTAQTLGLPAALIVAAQGFGSAIGNIVCPHNIVAGAATVGLAGREADILRRTLVPCALYLLLGGAAVALLSAWPAMA